MSKSLRTVALLTMAGLQILQLLTSASAQQAEARISVFAGSAPHAQVSGSFEGTRTDRRNLFFPADYAGITGLGERISNVRATDASGRPLSLRRVNSAEYVAESDISTWSYTVDLRPLGDRSALAHISWISDETGILMPGDLLPHGVMGSTIAIEGASAGKKIQIVGGGNNPVILVGNAWRIASDAAPGKPLATVISGEWQFSDDEFSKQTEEIFRAYDQLFGSDFSKESTTSGQAAQIAMAKFPAGVPWDQWEADTRGWSVTIMSSDTPFKSQSTQRLHEQLRHELFHLWIPERLALTGSYDWFYEGFALYQSLKLGVSVHRIRFEDMLGTLASAIDNDRSAASRLSLIEASKQRWIGNNNKIVYNRGLLVAFLCDLALLNGSKGKISTDTLVREVYSHRHEAVDANGLILRLMRGHPELIQSVDQYVSGSAAIDWPELLKTSGLQLARANGSSKLVLPAKPTGQQKALLKKLGYNSSLG